MWWKSSWLVANDDINEQISLNLELRLEYILWTAMAYDTVLPTWLLLL